MNGNENSGCALVVSTQNETLAAHWEKSLQDICKIFNTSDLAKLRECLKEFQPSVVFIDKELSELNLIEEIPQLLKISPHSRIIVFSTQYNEAEAISIIKAGAKGYALKHGDVLLLRKSIDVIRKGEFWIPRDLITRMIADFQDTQNERGVTHSQARTHSVYSSPTVRLDQLTRREQQIAELITNGYSNKEIGSVLKISESTVKAHLSAIYHKLGVLDRLALALLITRQTQRIAESA